MKHFCIPTARMVYSHHDVLACKQSVAREAQSQVNVADFRYIGNGRAVQKGIAQMLEHALIIFRKGYAHKVVGNIPTTIKRESGDTAAVFQMSRGAVLKSWTDTLWRVNPN
jgi:hypothetical protein